jgi:hypothetical protein
VLLDRFDPPAFLNDLSAQAQLAWSDFISHSIDQEMTNNPSHHFYNPHVTDTAADVQSAEISWTAFPRNVALGATSDLDRWQTADSTRDVQDEYCEWSVTRDTASGKITRVTFTCEGPEYWSFLASTDQQKVVDLYRAHIDATVKKEDLFVGSEYVPRNKWNSSTTRGAMHLIQGANTLGAEIDIAVRSSIVRKIQGVILTGEQELIECGRYGVRTRNSDPHIGGEINALARMAADITISNPVALYIKDLSVAGWKTPDASDPKQFWTVTRGDAQHALRAVYEVPAAKGYTVGDITINGQPIEFGAQIADFITIKIAGQFCRIGQNLTPPVTRCDLGASMTSGFSVAAAIHRPAAGKTR